MSESPKGRLQGRILVTGGTGFIGRSLIPKLLADGYQVRCLVRPESKKRADQYLPEGVEIAWGDMLEESSLPEAMTGCQGLVHMASPSSWSLIVSPAVIRPVLEGTQNVVQAAARAGVKRILLTSSVAALGPSGKHPLDEDSTMGGPPRGLHYAVAKREADAWFQSYLEDSDLEGITVYPSEVYGPRDFDFVTAANLVRLTHQRPRVVPTGGTSVAHVEDVAEGMLRAFQKGTPGDCFILGGENLSLVEMGNLVLEITGNPGRYRSLPWAILCLPALVERYLKFPLGLEPGLLDYARREWYVDNRKARRQLGLEFRPAREVFEATLEWVNQKR